MASHGKLRKERGSLTDYENQVKEIRWQLTEQIRCLEGQGELRRELLQDLGEFMRRRAEVELEYSKGLEKLSERFLARGGRISGKDRDQNFRKEPSLLSPLHCWYVLLQQTRQESRDHGALSEVLAGPLAQQLSHIGEDVGRLVKKVTARAQAEGNEGPGTRMLSVCLMSRVETRRKWPRKGDLDRQVLGARVGRGTVNRIDVEACLGELQETGLQKGQDPSAGPRQTRGQA